MLWVSCFPRVFAPLRRDFAASLLNFCSCTLDSFVIAYTAPSTRGTRMLTPTCHLALSIGHHRFIEGGAKTAHRAVY
jgi:hypothetical protein